MRRRTVLVSLSGWHLAARAAPRAFTLRAEPGYFSAKTLQPAAASAVLHGSMRITGFAGTGRWPTAAYLGVHQGPDRDDSVQVLAIRNRPSDDYLVIGFRLVINGREAKVQAIENVAVTAQIPVRVAFANGVATLHVRGGAPIEVKTPFSKVAPYASVSSGEAEFSIGA